ncbi:hypothetical protein ACTXG6_20185 [Pseudonocardia sp. Cha107L01]|uniref:hypothetical protein n=1 Tax=Pseudonocardia sp. Cha107L01 TaxID=3457576 RepID=UPI00403E928E
MASGVTTMLDWFHAAQTPEHTDAAIDALRAAPGRSVFCFGAGFRTSDPIDTEVRRVRSALPGDGLPTMALGLRGPEMTTKDIVADDLKLAAELGLHRRQPGRERRHVLHRAHGLRRAGIPLDGTWLPTTEPA